MRHQPHPKRQNLTWDQVQKETEKREGLIRQHRFVAALFTIYECRQAAFGNFIFS